MDVTYIYWQNVASPLVEAGNAHAVQQIIKEMIFNFPVLHTAQSSFEGENFVSPSSTCVLCDIVCHGLLDLS